MRIVRAKPTQANVNSAGNACATGFSLITHSTIDVRARPLHGVDVGEKRPARTLSREFWQQKNFRARRVRVSSPLAKTGFSRESRAADSELAGFVARTRPAAYGE
jgi:hypothetical protein